MSRLSVRWIPLTLLLAVGVTTATLADDDRRYEQGQLPLGQPGMLETRTSQRVASGVTYTRIARDEESAADYYTVFIFRPTLAEARELASQLRADGFESQVERIADRAFDDPTRGPLGWRVTVGKFQTLDDVNAQRDALTAAGYTLPTRVRTPEERRAPGSSTCWNSTRTSFRGEVVPVLGTGIVPANQLLTGIAAST